MPTSHNGVEIGNPVGLHYHYGTLGQLQHGINHAHAYLRNVGELRQLVMLDLYNNKMYGEVPPESTLSASSSSCL